MSELRRKLEELRQRAIDKGMRLRSEEELRMEENVLEALADLNKPPGLPEIAYWSEAMALWIYQIVELAVRNERFENKPDMIRKLPEPLGYDETTKQFLKDIIREVLAERLYWYPQPNWWQPIGEEATQAPDRGDPHVFDDYSPFNNRMTRRQREQKEKEDED